MYADSKLPEPAHKTSKIRKVSRRTQTYLRELLAFGEDMQDSDLEVIVDDEAEMIDSEYAHGLIENVIDGLSESDKEGGKKRKKKKRLAAKRMKEIPDFELADIMGDFEIDDMGNFIIMRGEKGELLDKHDHKVNKRGYLIDKYGNVVNKQGQVVFKNVELDSDEEIPAPFGFEKRKKNLLKLDDEAAFKVDEAEQNKETDIDHIDDEEIIEKELKKLKKGGDENNHSDVESLMGETPSKYN